ACRPTSTCSAGGRPGCAGAIPPAANSGTLACNIPRVCSPLAQTGLLGLDVCESLVEPALDGHTLQILAAAAFEKFDECQVVVADCLIGIDKDHRRRRKVK